LSLVLLVGRIRIDVHVQLLAYKQQWIQSKVKGEDRWGEGCRWRERTDEEKGAGGGRGQMRRRVQVEGEDRWGEGCRWRERTDEEKGAGGMGWEGDTGRDEKRTRKFAGDAVEGFRGTLLLEYRPLPLLYFHLFVYIYLPTDAPVILSYKLRTSLAAVSKCDVAS
jgi:hypothetical protein